jgi:hypothetical protein
MKYLQVFIAAAAIAGFYNAQITPAKASATASLESPEIARSDPIPNESPDGTQRVSHWFLCVTEESAKAIVDAGKDAFEKTREIYLQMNAQKLCGQMESMQVRIEETIYTADPKAAFQTTVYHAKVQMGESPWLYGFVFSN